MAVPRQHVGGEPAQGQARHPRGQVLAALADRQDDEAGVQRDQVQAAQLLLRRPADPAVAHADLEGPGLPAEQGRPGAVQGGHMAQGAAEQAAEGQVVTGGCQAVPAPVLGSP